MLGEELITTGGRPMGGRQICRQQKLNQRLGRDAIHLGLAIYLVRPRARDFADAGEGDGQGISNGRFGGDDRPSPRTFTRISHSTTEGAVNEELA